MTATLPPWVGHVSIPNSAWKDGIVPLGSDFDRKARPVRRQVRPRFVCHHRDGVRWTTGQLVVASLTAAVVAVPLFLLIEKVLRRG